MRIWPLRPRKARSGSLESERPRHQHPDPLPDPDDPIQSSRANHIVDRTLSADEPGFVSLVTIAEVAWVLRSRYKATRQEIALTIERILASDSLRVQNEQQVYEAMLALKAGEGTF